MTPSVATPSPAAGKTPSPATITIALPKGRTLGPVSKIFARAGLTGEGDATLATVLDENNRALVRRAMLGEHTIDLLLLKPDDVPTYVEYGTADLGICGRDVLAERNIDAYHPLDLGIGRCRLVVAGRVGESFDRIHRMPRIATKYPHIAARHFARRGVQVEIVNVLSSVELAPLTGLADLIVDLVETGTTLKQNGLEVKEEILAVSTLLVANRASYKLRAEPIRTLLDSLRAALGA